jgi:uncharacterized protein YjiK
MTFCARLLTLALAVAACAPASEPQAQPRGEQTGQSLFAAEPAQHWRLRGPLRELSGLAVTADGRVFGHDDEVATLYEIDPIEGRILKSFSVTDSNGPLHGDFEGIAITPDGDFYLTASTGDLYRFREGGDRANVPFQRFDSHLRGRCEVEGLTYLSAEESLILACKNNYALEMRDTVALYAWSTRTQALRETPWLTLPARPLASGSRQFHTSSVEIDARTGRVILLAARENAMAEVTRDGRVLATRALGALHSKAEGSAILPDGSLVIADEGPRHGQALITRYPRRP